MMHDNWLIALALATSAIGIVGLLFALIVMEAPLSSVDDAKQAQDGAPLRVKGEVTSVQRKGNLTLVRVTQPSTIDVVTSLAVNLSAGDCVTVTGKRSSYNDAPQLSATRIKRC